tara:strand:- start:1810 stop:1944 length:135 start_codon:yes stop_codon:yes gene_type:complete
MEFKMSLPMKEQQHYLQQRERERERKNERHYSERIKERKVLLLL